jgi:NADPH-dependent glutamate synthase beta subunit-like oxidoreductase
LKTARDHGEEHTSSYAVRRRESKLERETESIENPKAKDRAVVGIGALGVCCVRRRERERESEENIAKERKKETHTKMNNLYSSFLDRGLAKLSYHPLTCSIHSFIQLRTVWLSSSIKPTYKLIWSSFSFFNG